MDPKITTNKEFNQQVRNDETRASIVDSLAMPVTTDVDFEPHRLADELLRLPELSLWA